MDKKTKEEILADNVPASCWWADMRNFDNCPEKYIHAAMDVWATQQTADLKAELEQEKENLRVCDIALGGVIKQREGLKIKIESLQAENEALKAELGMMEIDRNHYKTLLDACEKALEKRDAENEALKESLKSVKDSLNWHIGERNRLLDLLTPRTGE